MCEGSLVPQWACVHHCLMGICDAGVAAVSQRIWIYTVDSLRVAKCLLVSTKKICLSRAPCTLAPTTLREVLTPSRPLRPSVQAAVSAESEAPPN